jgi:probable F420-dependent oxidoreductase
MARLKVGVQFHPQHTTVDTLRHAWTAADALGVDSIWIWDHFFPLYAEGAPYLWPPSGNPTGLHYESWTLLAAMAVDTKRARVGVLISNINFRNPDLLADMARTVDHLSGGRVILGLGAGNIDRDSKEYGYSFGSGRERLRALEDGISRIRRRLSVLEPPPVGPMPLLIGGSGQKVTLRLVAEHADMWNSFGPPVDYAAQNAALNEWCERVGRDPATIERTVLLDVPEEGSDLEGFVKAGVQHVIVGCQHPFDLNPVRELQQAAARFLIVLSSRRCPGTPVPSRPRGKP